MKVYGKAINPPVYRPVLDVSGAIGLARVSWGHRKVAAQDVRAFT